MNKKKSGGLLIGLIMIIAGTVLLFYNEKNNVKNIKTVDELKKEVVDVSSSEIDSKNNGKLIATNGSFVVEDKEVVDSTFNVSLKTAVLKRTVEVYQWEEDSTEEENTTKYTYKKKWSDKLIDSSEFNDKSYTNPTTKAYESATYTSNVVKVGNYYLSASQIESLSTDKNLTLEGMNGIYLRSGVNIKNNYITNSSDIENPSIGDYRISYSYNDYKEASVLAVQSDSSFTDFTSKAGKNINRVFEGKLTSTQMIQKIENENNTLKWILRLAGGFIIIFGYIALFSGLNRLLEYIPILGKIASSILSLVAGLIGLIHTLVIIIIAWFRYRPLLSIILIALIVAIIIFIKMKKKKNPVENNNAQILNTNQVFNETPVEQNTTTNTEINTVDTTTQNKE